jgi:hypothetical protein
MTSLPKREMSCLLADVLINSIPQQAVANGMGQRLFDRHQLAAESSVVQNKPLFSLAVFPFIEISTLIGSPVKDAPSPRDDVS